MRHPSLPPTQEIEVDEQAVPHHANAGWIPVPAEELEARAAAAAKAAAEKAAAEKAAAERGGQLAPSGPPRDDVDQAAESRREGLEKAKDEAVDLPATDDESAAPKRRRRAADPE